MKFLKEKAFELWDPILFVLLRVFSNPPAQTSKAFSFKNFMRDMGLKKGRSYKFVFIIFSIFIFIHCGGGNSNPSPIADDSPKKDSIVPPTREVARDPACVASTPPIPFITEVVSYKIGPGGGFHWKSLPKIILGSPKGYGTFSQGQDVFSLGQQGEIVVKMGVPILDGEGSDFIVFENAFYINGDPKNPYAEPGIVSVSRDGINFKTFPCQNGNWKDFYHGCAGVNPVFTNSNYNPIDPTDPKIAGGDLFDLKDVGLNCVQYIKIEDGTLPEDINPHLSTVLDDASDQGGIVGFDLDAISAVYY